MTPKRREELGLCLDWGVCRRAEGEEPDQSSLLVAALMALSVKPQPSRTVNIPVQKLIAELPLGIVLLAQSQELRQPFVARTQLCGSRRKQLSPMAHTKWRQLFLDHWQQSAHRRPTCFQVK
jgi:hypothetical protein